MASSDTAIGIRPEKTRYYDDIALDKRAARAARARLKHPYLLALLDLPAPDIILASNPIARPRPLEHFTDVELLAKELWCRRTAAMIWRRVRSYITTSQRAGDERITAEVYPHGHEPSINLHH
jgi:hypothetical protein